MRWSIRTAIAFLVVLASPMAPVAHHDGPSSWPLQSVLVPVTAAAAAPTLLRDPYLTDDSGSWATVSLATNMASPAPVVSWGPATGNCTSPPNSVNATFVTSFGTGDQQFKAQMTGLLPNTNYCYRVTQSGLDLIGTAPVFASALASGATDTFSFAVIGDWGAGTTDEAKVLSQISTAKPSFIVTSGDNAYPSGSQSDYGDLSGGNVFGPAYWPRVGRTMPAFLAEGNHGFTTNLPYLQNWPEDGTVAACASSGCRYQDDTYCCTATLGTSSYTYPSSWYAFDWGNSRFYILEGAWSDVTGGYQGDFDAHLNGPVSGCAVCGTELTTLVSDLASHAPLHKFAFWHYPLYADSSSQPSDSYLDGPNNLEGVLAQYGVNIVFNGHAHQYERNYPQITGSPMLSYVTGGGGAALGSVSGQSSFDAYAKAIFHYLLVMVSGSSVTVTPTDENGATFDVQTYTFGAPPPPSNDFSISASPASLSLSAGQGGTTTISTVVTSGSAQTVSLSLSGLPAGATGSFNPSAVTAGGSSTLSISTASSTPGGSYTLTVTGTGTTATHTTTVGLTVTGLSATPQLVQAAGATETSTSTTLTATFPTTTSAGHLLVLSASVYTGGTNQITQVTDSANNTWTRIGAFYSASHYSDGEIWYAANANPVTTVTVKLASATVVAMEVEEFSGVATSNPLDVSAGASNTGTSASSGPATPTASTDLAVGFIAGHGSTQGITVTAAGYTAQAQQTSTNGGSTPVSVVTGYQVLSSTATQNFTGSFTAAMYWASGIVLFRAG
ncbi:MAG: metallophosphoesterase family protein [Chloroflexi bacterium]|nr:MAG: metallophosphoesterase family protein [Chloroflexota bacterium]